jgi:hypothetical protein
MEMEMDKEDGLPDDDTEVPENVEGGSWDAIMLDEDDEDFEVEIDSDS